MKIVLLRVYRNVHAVISIFNSSLCILYIISQRNIFSHVRVVVVYSNYHFNYEDLQLALSAQRVVRCICHSISMEVACRTLKRRRTLFVSHSMFVYKYVVVGLAHFYPTSSSLHIIYTIFYNLCTIAMCELGVYYKHKLIHFHFFFKSRFFLLKYIIF